MFFSLCHIDISSIKANLSHFENYLQLLSIDFPVIAITETWLNDITCDLYSLPGYNFTEQHRSDKCGGGGGGVGIFVHDHMNYSERNDLSVFNDYCESLFIEVDQTNIIKEKNIVIGVIYQPPNTDIPHFIDIMKDTILHTILIWDMNWVSLILFYLWWCLYKIYLNCFSVTIL